MTQVSMLAPGLGGVGHRPSPPLKSAQQNRIRADARSRRRVRNVRSKCRIYRGRAGRTGRGWRSNQ